MNSSHSPASCGAPAPVTPHELARIVRTFIPSAEVRAIYGPMSGGFSGDCIYKVATESAEFALRGRPHGAIPPRRLQELHRFTRFLHSEGFPTAVPLCTPLGSTTHDTPRYVWQLEPWLAGEADRSVRISSPRLAHAITVLVQLHRCASRYEPSASGAAWFRCRTAPAPAVAERRERIASWSPARITAAMEAIRPAPDEMRSMLEAVVTAFVLHAGTIDQELADLQEQVFSLHPCLRDLYRAHLLFVGDRVSGLIDLSAARTDHPAADLARLLGSLFGDDRSGWSEALMHYEQVRPLSAAEHRLLNALDRSGVLLSGMTWVERWSGGLVAAERQPAVTDRLRAIVARLQRWQR